jgi:hypothetical protein
MHVRQLERTDGANSARENCAAESGRRRGNVSLQVDPDVANGWQAYAYVDNNPVHNIDPLGLEWYDPRDWNWECIACGALIAGAAALVVANCGVLIKEQEPGLAPVCVAAIGTYLEVMDSCGVCLNITERTCPAGFEPKEDSIGVGWHCEPVENGSLFSWWEDHAFEGNGNFLGFDPHEGTRPDPEKCPLVANSSSCPGTPAASGPRVPPMDQPLWSP